MAHGITNTDGMMYVGEVPWHGLGTELPNLATAQEALEAAELDWEVGREPVCSKKGLSLPNQYLNVRQDTGEPLGVVGSRYQILQNRDAFRFLDNITQDPNGPKYVTAGSLWGGRRIWLLAKLPSMIKVTRADVIDEYLLLTHGHTGLHQIEVLYTPVRVVCNNTLSYSLSGKTKAKAKFKHIDLTNKVGQAQDILGIINNKRDSLITIINELKSFEPTEEEIDTTIAKLFPASGEEASSKIVAMRDKVKDLVENGKGQEFRSVRNTGWAFYNAVTEFVDHYKPVVTQNQIPMDARFDSLLWGNGAQVKSHALELISTLRD